MSKPSSLNLPVCLIIMDGFGLAAPSEGNAIALAKKPHIGNLLHRFSHTKLEASGKAVGLPEGQMGNSEVGHLNIGAGRVVLQELTRIDHACTEGSLAENHVIVDACEQAKKPGAILHLMGLLSDGGVHSSNKHLYALLDVACKQKVPQIKIHCFLDGRDVSPSSALDYLKELEQAIGEFANDETTISIGSISGRYYAMDRDRRWERVERCYKALVEADPLSKLTPADFVQASYDEGVTDEFVVPGAFDDRGILDGDTVLFFNFRPDRAREITRAIVDFDFCAFKRTYKPKVDFVCLTEYDPTINAKIAFKKSFPQHVLADVLAEEGLRQYHIAETEKYAHVTFFFNGGVEQPKKNETRILVPSPKVATYDLQPEMSGPEVADILAAAIENDEADVYIVNFANCDMVGHTGSIPATIKAVEAVDEGVGRVLGALEKKGGSALLTADHGNADKMLDEDGKPFTAHTNAPVPLVLIDYSGNEMKLLQEYGGSLGSIAPTLLEMIGLTVPEEMSGKSFLAK